jgi:hypothetical protein
MQRRMIIARYSLTCSQFGNRNPKERNTYFLTTHDYVVILCKPLTFAIPAFVVVVWRVRSLRLTDETPQCMYKRLFDEVCRQ